MIRRLNVAAVGLGLCVAMVGCSGSGVDQVAFGTDGKPNADLQQAATGFAEQLSRHDEKSLAAYSPAGQPTTWAASWSRSCSGCDVKVVTYHPDADSGSIASVEYSATCGKGSSQFRVTWVADSDRWAASVADSQQPPTCG